MIEDKSSVIIQCFSMTRFKIKGNGLYGTYVYAEQMTRSQKHFINTFAFERFCLVT